MTEIHTNITKMSHPSPILILFQYFLSCLAQTCQFYTQTEKNKQIELISSPVRGVF